MNTVRCENGHWVDADKYNECPVRDCGARLVMATTPQEKDDTEGYFQRELVPPSTIDPERSISIINRSVESDKKGEDGDSVQNEIKGAKPADDETQGTFKRTKTGEASSTAEYPAGWLLGIKGVNIGKVYPILECQNTIGRNNNYTIALVGDKYVSASNTHAKLIYEPNSRKFYITSGDSQSLAYLNSSLIMSPTELNIYDKISFGADTPNEYMFIPLCCEKFSWKDFMGE